MTSPRPVCVHCGKPYGRHATTDEVVRWDTPTKEVPTVYKGEITGTMTITVSADDGRMVMYRTVWDGESWVGGYEPFCKLRCALDYARRAYARATAARPRVVAK